MNDFTKDELEYISDSIYFNELEHHLEEDIPNHSKQLLEKIQRMIENYCEHENEGKNTLDN